MDTPTFQKGRCLNCDKPILYGILCLDCDPETSDQTVSERESMIQDMKEGDFGYTEEYAIFEVDSKLYVIGTARILTIPDRYKTVRIQLRHNIFEIDRQTLDTDEIYVGWPDMNDHPDCFQAKLV